MTRFVAVVVLTALAALAAAQQKSALPDPADPAAPAPPAKHESAFGGYTPYREQDVASWRDLNDEVARAGGHAGIFRGAGQAGHAPAKAATKPSATNAASPSKPAPGKTPGAERK